MLVIRCKNCNVELTSSPKTQVCGCSNNTTLTDDKISAVDLSRVLIISNNKLDDSQVRFTYAGAIDYNNEDTEACLDWKFTDPMAKGIYEIQIFNNGFMVGQGNFKLK